MASNLVGGMAATGCFCMVASGQCDAVGALSGTTTSLVVAIAWLDSVNSDVTLLCAAFIASFDTIELRELSGTTFDFSTWKTWLPVHGLRRGELIRHCYVFRLYR